MLPLPLKHYDQAGHIKPHWIYWLICLYPCRALIALVLSLSNIQDQSLLISLLYPNQKLFYWSLVPIVFALVPIGLASYREKLWLANRYRFFVTVKGCLLAAYLIDIAILLWFGTQQHWRFSWPIALGILGNLALLLTLARSQHIQLMLLDWQRP